ncbi:MAG TPA: zf-HC2 domain-containing protein [Longimicrobium sp.]|nr:zf-HC2 domain-containing protein [Longimicrobium sp.]
MNRHLGEGTLQALIDGELSPADRAAAETHLAACPACAAELRELRATHERVATLLGRADVAAPVAQAQMSMRARRLRARRPAVHWPQALLRAAVLVLGLAGVAAAAVPGSPVRAWIVQNVVPRPRPAQAPRLHPVTQAPPARPAAPPEKPAGISIRTEKDVVRVVLTGVSPRLQIVARLVDGDRAGVVARGPRDYRPRFRTSPGRIEVIGTGADALEVSLPRGAGRAVVEVNGRVYVTKQGESLILLPPATTGNGPSVRVGG